MTIEEMFWLAVGGVSLIIIFLLTLTYHLREQKR